MKHFRAFGRRALTVAAVVLTIAVASHQAQATVLNPGGVVVPAAGANPLAGTTILGNTTLLPYNQNGITGTYQAWALNNFAGNPYGLGSLTFVYQFTYASGTSSALESATMASFVNWNTDVTVFSQSGGQKVPVQATRTAFGDIIKFSFGANSLTAGQQSVLMVINTNAPNFIPGTYSVQDGSVAQLTGFAPVPEPGSIALLGIGIVVAGLGMKRARANRV